MPEKLQTVDLTDVEIARVGEWMGTDHRNRPVKIKFTRELFDEFEEAHKAAREKVGEEADMPVKLGHDMKQAIFGELADELRDGEPAFGWITEIRRKGDKLVANLKKVAAGLQPYMEAGAWRRRSLEFDRNYTLGGQTHPWMVTALSLLGAAPPAVEGLADVYRVSRPDGTKPSDDWRLVSFRAAAADDDETDLDRAISRWMKVFTEDIEPLLFARPGAPAGRRLHQLLVTHVRQAARKNMPKEGRMHSAILALLDLSDDATPESFKAALSKAGAGTRRAILKLADAWEKEWSEAEGTVRAAMSTDAGLAVISELVGKPGAEVDEVVAAVRELVGAMPAEDDDDMSDEGGLEPPPEEVGMAKGDLSARLKAIEEELAAEKAERAKTTLALSRAQAEKRVDDDIQKFRAAAAVRETLVELAQEGRDDLYKNVLETARKVPTEEKGTSRAGKLSEIELTPEEVAEANRQKLDLNALRAHKAKQMGIQLSEPAAAQVTVDEVKLAKAVVAAMNASA